VLAGWQAIGSAPQQRDCCIVRRSLLDKGGSQSRAAGQWVGAFCGCHSSGGEQSPEESFNGRTTEAVRIKPESHKAQLPYLLFVWVIASERCVCLLHV
jgi:hypothetical protein